MATTKQDLKNVRAINRTISARTKILETIRSQGSRATPAQLRRYDELGQRGNELTAQLSPDVRNRLSLSPSLFSSSRTLFPDTPRSQSSASGRNRTGAY